MEQRSQQQMSDISERYRRVAAQFSRTVAAVPPDAWDAPAPCEGWAARDVVGHLTEWLPSFFFTTWAVEHPPIPTAKEDPAGAWSVLDTTLQRCLDDPAVADAVRETRMGTSSFAEQFDMIGRSDVLIHTWDLARATGVTEGERLDPEMVHDWVEAMEPMDQMLRESGHYGPRVPVPDDADEQTRLLAFLGRHP
jgi:uncharacterized protein (TIGR03086 family)